MNEPLFMTNNSMENLSARLLKQRTVLLFGTLDEELSSKVISSLLYLSAEDQEKPITLMINSAGGDETEALAIFDVMQSISCPIHTVCLGKAHGMAALLLAAGEKG
ncbi:MAG: ATP-dependent Clp protease proteolytic subunit, partial [Clostridia bacterium]|nr:ATP-dependent Clp protease proteolytic subunit [Clostridia bacterium]